jgi:hypothetical protein
VQLDTFTVIVRAVVSWLVLVPKRANLFMILVWMLQSVLVKMVNATFALLEELKIMAMMVPTIASVIIKGGVTLLMANAASVKFKTLVS